MFKLSSQNELNQEVLKAVKRDQKQHHNDFCKGNEDENRDGKTRDVFLKDL